MSMHRKVTARARAAVRAACFCAAALLPATRASAQTCENARPTSAAGSQGLSYGKAEASFFDSPSGRARVHYALTGAHAPALQATQEPPTPDVVVVAARAAEDALTKYQELAYEPPLSDANSPCPSNGGNDALDIYLVHFASADGQAVPDHCAADSARRCAGFVLVENDFRGGGYRNTTEGMRTVIPHELFHLVQHAYDADVEPWWAEGSAQWAAKQVSPDVQDLERFLPVYFESPWRPLNVPPGGVVASFLYATAIWPVFLSERYGSERMREVFESLADSAGNVLDATDGVLKAQDSSLAAGFLEFAAYNAATAERASPDQGYADAANYPLLDLTPFQAVPGASVSDVAAGLGAFYYSIEVAAAVELKLEGDPERVRALFLPLEGAALRPKLAQPLPVVVEQAGVVVVAGQSRLRTDAPFSLRAETPTKEPLGKPGAEEGSASSGSCSLGSVRSTSAGDSAAILCGLLALWLCRATARRARFPKG